MPTDINFMIGGEAGQGVQSTGFILAKVFLRGGYHVFVDQDYESRVRGGHNFYRVRVKDSRVGAISEAVDILIALNEESIDLHKKELTPDGFIIFDNKKIKTEDTSDNYIGIPLEKLAEEKAGNKLMANTVALGVIIGLVDYDFKLLEKVLPDHFGTGETAENNIKAARAGYDYTRENRKIAFREHLKPISTARRMLLNGNEAIALGSIAAGCKFMAAYPMTPVSSIMEYLADKAKEYDIIVIQPEDEIAAINMVIGASYAGVRAMTATSGGGFCLMVEGIGLAGITETPIVVVEGQRPGPAIGLPTRTDQGDLNFVLHAAHGEFPRAVFAPSTMENAFWLTVKAFNIAEKYQIPVMIITDQHLASSYATVDKFDISKVTIDRGILFSEENASDYKRHRFTESGISPRAFPLLKGTIVATDSDEHNEEGHLIEDAETRTRMMQKRMHKLESLKKEISPPVFYGDTSAEMTLIGWGSTYGAIRETVDILRKDGNSINSLHITELWPFPVETVTRAIENTNTSYVVENNITGQLARLIQAETGKKVTGSILRYDGRPFTPAQIAREIWKGGS